VPKKGLKKAKSLDLKLPAPHPKKGQKHNETKAKRLTTTTPLKNCKGVVKGFLARFARFWAIAEVSQIEDD
jgi:hypothetical protein